MLRSLLIILPPSIAALLAWALLPDTIIDSALFSLSAKTIANPPFFITGNGTHENPHTLRTLRSSSDISSTELPVNITISDDPDQIFQSSPPSPVDFAVILKNLRRLGTDSVTIAMPLSWQDPYLISLIALDQQLDAFPAPITSTPLSRNPVPSPIPPAFRRASIPLSEIKGDISSLPIVNRIPFPDVILGNKTSLAGFSILESETQTDHPHLIARWDDRVVFSLLFLTTLDHFKKNISTITIKPGKYISLDIDGPYIPIDSFGRLTTLPPSISRSDLSPVNAAELIDAPDDFLSNKSSKPAIIRNTLSSSEDNQISFSDTIIPTIAMLCHPNGTTNARPFPRIPWLPEILLLASLNSIIFCIAHLHRTRKRLVLSVLALTIVVLHFIIFTSTSHWPPTLPSLIAILIAIALPSIPTRKITSPDPSETPEPTLS